MLLGDIGVGKTSLVRRLSFNTFGHQYKATIGVDVYTHKLSLDIGADEIAHIKLLIWDIDGDFGESIFKQIYIKGATAALVIGDYSRRATMGSVTTLAHAFTQQFPGRPVVLVANKADVMPVDELPKLTASLHRFDAPVIATSAKTGANVLRSFEMIARSAYERGL